MAVVRIVFVCVQFAVGVVLPVVMVILLFGNVTLIAVPAWLNNCCGVFGCSLVVCLVVVLVFVVLFFT